MYRNDIDGLRTVAVLPVVLFHAGFTALSGGYVGVDVFFVISGYLITDHLYKEVQHGHIDILRFYERRIRRIFPAFFFLLACVLIAGFFLLLPLELVNLAQSALAATFSASNIWFYFDSGYFSAAAGTKPLLHTWSLGVEEQYYLFWPIALGLLHRYLRNHLLTITLGLCVLSLALSAVTINVSPSATFYMLPTRAWELLAGAALALAPYRPRRYREAISAVGMAMIVIPMVIYTPETLFPGLAALPVVLGSVLVLASAENTAIGRLLSTAPMRGVGLISYSLYLWHWPPLAFANLYYNFAVPVSVSAACVLFALVMAAFSWRFVEQPFRRRPALARGPSRALVGGGVAMASFAVLSVFLLDGRPNRLPERVLAMANSAALPDLSKTPCFRTEGDNPDVGSCLAASDGERLPHTTVLWGDSHARPFADPLRQRVSDLRVVGRSGCLPIVGFVPGRGDRVDQRCATLNEQILSELVASPHVKTVILTGRWARLFFPMADPEAQRLVATDGRSVAPDEALRRSLEQTVRELEGSGKHVIVVGDVPEFTTSLPECMARAMWLDLHAAQCAHHRGTLPDSISAHEMHEMAQDFQDVQFVWPHDTLCPQGTCLRTLNGMPVMTDTDHVTEAVAAEVLRKVQLDSGPSPVLTGV